MLQTSTIDLINTILISAGIGICGMCLLHIAASTNLNRVIRRYFLLFFPVLLLNMSMHLVRQSLDGSPGAGVRTAMQVMPFIEGNAAMREYTEAAEVDYDKKLAGSCAAYALGRIREKSGLG